MSGATIARRLTLTVASIAWLASAGATAAYAQAKPRLRTTSARPVRSVEIGGYAMVGKINFTAAESFDAILGAPSGSVIGGGARVGLPWGGLFVDLGAWRFHGTGERAFVFNNEVIPLGIPVDVKVTPIELTGGWRFRLRRLPKLVPYAGGGFTSMTYRETSDFSTATEDVDETFNGYHVLGGAAYKISRWLGVAGEASWTTVPEAIGKTGVSDAFDETDLGGTTFRIKITIGR
jgi:opacity protein-like surface antigen